LILALQSRQPSAFSHQGQNPVGTMESPLTTTYTSVPFPWFADLGTMEYKLISETAFHDQSFIREDSLACGGAALL
jgi:hypothetical protein